VVEKEISLELLHSTVFLMLPTTNHRYLAWSKIRPLLEHGITCAGNSSNYNLFWSLVVLVHHRCRLTYLHYTGLLVQLVKEKG
jgi:hypothetical protein